MSMGKTPPLVQDRAANALALFCSTKCKQQTTTLVEDRHNVAVLLSQSKQPCGG